MSEGDTRRYHKVIHQHIMEVRVESGHLPIQHAEAVQLARDFMPDSGQYL
jgi:hypothetical protein